MLQIKQLVTALFTLMSLWMLQATALAQNIVQASNSDDIVRKTFATGDVEFGGTGNWYLEIQQIPDPLQEAQAILPFDLSAFHGKTFQQAELGYFVGGGAHGTFTSVKIETRFFNSKGLPNLSDFDMGTQIVGMFSWDSPTPDFPTPPIDEWATFDVLNMLNNRSGDFISFNLRYSGDPPNYNGNVFFPEHPFRFLAVASSDNGDISLRPYLKLTVQDVPEPGSLTLIVGGATAGLMALWTRQRKTPGISDMAGGLR